MLVITKYDQTIFTDSIAFFIRTYEIIQIKHMNIRKAFGSIFYIVLNNFHLLHPACCCTGVTFNLSRRRQIPYDAARSIKAQIWSSGNNENGTDRIVKSFQYSVSPFYPLAFCERRRDGISNN